MLNVLDKILILGIAAAVTIMAQNPTTPMRALKRAQIQMIREVSRTDNWGDPRIGRHTPYKRAGR